MEYTKRHTHNRNLSSDIVMDVSMMLVSHNRLDFIVNIEAFFFLQQTAILLLKLEVAWVTRPE